MAIGKMKTRAKGSAKTAAEALTATKSTAPKVPLGPESTNPPKLFILPEDASLEARIVTIANPRTLLHSRYLCCPKKGFYEFTKVAAPKTTPRSILLAPSDDHIGQEKRLEKGQKARASAGDCDEEHMASKGYVTKAAEMFVATPIDSLFLILPALAQAPPPTTRDSEPTKRLFLESDDYFDRLSSTSPHLRPFLRTESTRRTIEARMAAVCDTVEAGDETMYRLNEVKLLQELLHKAKKVVEFGLPASIEEKFVRKALEVPMLNLKRGESSIHEPAEEVDAVNVSGTVTPAADSVDSQTTISSTETLATSVSFTSTAATSSCFEANEGVVPSNPTSTPTPTPGRAPIAIPEGIPHLLRLRTALNFIISSYLPSHLQPTILNLLEIPSPSFVPPSTPKLIDFTPLSNHLNHLAKLRQDALAFRSLSDFSRKRSMNEDEECGETRADKKRKKEEEDKRKKAGESRGVRDLKKVNVKGMKKMSDFFSKKS